MHAEAFAYVRQAVAGKTFPKVLEFGSRNINGTVRPLFGPVDFHGIDVEPGPGVDEVADAAEWQRKGFDCVVCCEVFEHTPKSAQIVAAARRALVKGGVFIATCATTGRGPHSAADGAELRDGEFYRNATRVTFEKWLRDAGFASWDITIRDVDLYCTAVA